MSEQNHVTGAEPRCRRCDKHPACLRNRRAPMLCFACASRFRVFEQYALPPERVVAHLEAALDAMVLEAIRRGRTDTTVEPALKSPT